MQLNENTINKFNQLVEADLKEYGFTPQRPKKIHGEMQLGVEVFEGNIYIGGQSAPASVIPGIENCPGAADDEVFLTVEYTGDHGEEGSLAEEITRIYEPHTGLEVDINTLPENIKEEIYAQADVAAGEDGADWEPDVNDDIDRYREQFDEAVVKKVISITEARINERMYDSKGNFLGGPDPREDDLADGNDSITFTATYFDAPDTHPEVLINGGDAVLADNPSELQGITWVDGEWVEDGEKAAEIRVDYEFNYIQSRSGNQFGSVTGMQVFDVATGQEITGFDNDCLKSLAGLIERTAKEEWKNAGDHY
jgi:hypothetical protein